MPLHLDFETRSVCDLRRTGSYVYSKDPTTEVLCVGLAIDDGKSRILSPKKANEIIKDQEHVIAHNARFEIDIWNGVCVSKYGWDPITVDRMTCTMVMAYAMGLPGSLDEASAAVGLQLGKDVKGKRVMMQLCKPRSVSEEGEVRWYDKVEYRDKYQKLYRYCAQDVEVERQLYKRLRKLSPYEKKVWEIDQRINDRGIGIDVKAAEVAYQIVQLEKDRLNSKLMEVTNGSVATCTANTAFLRWINSCGVRSDSIAKSSLEAMLRRKDVPNRVRTALLLRKEAAKTSTAKLKAMLEAQYEGRIRGTLQYHAAATGRWGGRKVQPQNFPRPKLNHSDIEEVFRVLHG